MKRLISSGLIFIIVMLSIMPATVWATGEEAVTVLDFASLVSDLPGNAVDTGREDFATAKFLPAEVTAGFSDADMAGVASGDTVMLCFAVKAVSKSTALDISVAKADGTTVAMTYYAPLQWTSINMPLVGSLSSVTVATAADAVLLGSATVTDRDSTDLSDPSLKGGMWMIDSFDTYVLDEAEAVGSDSIDLVKSGSYVYTIGSSGTFTVTDVSDIDNPVVRGALNLGASLRQIALCKSGTDVMISARQDGAFIVDVSDPSSPKIRSRYDTIEFATGMHIYEDYAYISCRQFGVEVVDISDLDNPRHTSIVRCGEAQSCEVVGGILYAGLWGECAVDMYDVSNPAAPVKLGRAPLNGKGDGMKVRQFGGKTYLYAATGQHTVSVAVSTPLTDLRYGQGNGLDIFDVTDPSNPVWLSTSKIDGRYYYTGNDYWETDVTTDGDRVYASLVNTYNGVYIFDVTNPEAPVRVANVNIRIPTTSENYPGVYTHSSRALVFPYDQSQYHQSPVGAIVCEEGAMYIAGVFTGLHIFRNDDILLPAAEDTTDSNIKAEGSFYGFDPSEYELENFSSYRSDGQTYAVATSGDYIYLANGMEGIVVLDSDLGKVGGIDTEGFAMDIVIYDGIAYVAQGDDGLVTYEINGAKLTQKSKYNIYSGSARQVRLSPKARFAAVHASSNAVELINLSTGSRVAKYTTNTQGYFRNLSQSLIAGRYLAFYGNAGKTYWFDFGVDDDYDVPKVVENPLTAEDNVYFDISSLHMQSGYENLDGKAFGFTGSGTYVLYDVANPGVAAMSSLTKYKTNVSALGKPVVYGSKLAMGDRVNGDIYFGDVSDREAIQITGSVKVAGNPEMPVITDKYILFPLGHQGLFRFDVPKPEGAGLFGKTDDEIAAAETMSNSSKLNTVVSFDENYSFSDKPYAVLDLNFAPTTDWQSATCGPDAGIATITQSFGDGVIKNNRWNNVRIVVKEKTAAEIAADNYYQPMRMYINGQEIKGTESANVRLDTEGYRYKLNSGDNLVTGATTANRYYGRGFRFSLIAPSGDTATAYVTDVKKYGSDGVSAPVMPSIPGKAGVYTVESGMISGEKAVTVGDITAEGYSVRVYEDSTMETIIDNSSAILREGNVIVAADDVNKLYSYYTYGNKNMLYEFTEGTISQSVSGGTKSVYADSIGGKADTVMKITRTDENVTAKKETYFDIVYDADRSDGIYSANMSTADFMTNTTAKYVVLEMDYYPTDEANRFSIAGHLSSALTSTSNYISRLNKNQWNKIALVVSNNCDAGNPTPGSTQYTKATLPSNIHTYQLFINGTLAQEGSMNRFGYYWYDTRDRRECFFRIAVAGNNDAACDVYLDNIMLYDTNVVDCTEYAEIYGKLTDTGAEFSTAKTEGVMLVAAYDGSGNLVGNVSFKKLGSGINTVSIDAVSGAESYTAYVWKNLSAMTPLCDKVQLSVQ